MSFSSAIVLTDLNDFITPSQACIKPAMVKPVSESALTSVQTNEKGNYYEVTKEGTHTKLEAAKISLNDCLACSGCITSAESVLITLQSHKEVFSVIEANALLEKEQRLLICVSISPQSRASMAAKYGLTTDQIRKRLAWFFKAHLSVDHVLDIAFARDFSLIESATEFVRRFKENSSDPQQKLLPVVTSACPGWICYAEKTHPDILPLIDSTKSPQQIMGSVIKDYLANQLDVEPSRIYHVTVMPCYDKKLEASRQDFYNDIYKTRDVDCVITTGEVERMVLEQGMDIRSVQEIEEDTMFEKLGKSQGSSSGGYLSHTMRYAAQSLFGVTLSPEDIQDGTNGVTIVPGRNPDSTDVSFTPPGATQPALRFAYSYGFRNIQNLVRKVRPGKPLTTLLNPRRVNSSAASGSGKYHYVEVMACPSGCINGGGQLKPDSILSTTDAEAGNPKTPAEHQDGAVDQPPATQKKAGNAIAAPEVEPIPIDNLSKKQWVALADAAYQSSDAPVELPEGNTAVKRLYREWLGGSDSKKARTLLHTHYHAVEAPILTSTSGLVEKW
ncbi:hypothetical protein BSLG_009220 [Batrachochytrium salamandrivorans]|nr:hypothetical protein BASA60_006978 [Batrachochytrium salamandrivorans]KAJ1330768.1 hypothetical protein BSLG_009220 [Batrachochytrium salamandrivorans]